MKTRILAAIRGALAAAAIGAAAPAHADEIGYLNALAADGASMTQGNTLAAIEVGRLACSMLYLGQPESQVETALLENPRFATPGATPQELARDAKMVVQAAHSQLCPDAG